MVSETVWVIIYLFCEEFVTPLVFSVKVEFACESDVEIRKVKCFLRTCTGFQCGWIFCDLNWMRRYIRYKSNGIIVFDLSIMVLARENWVIQMIFNAA